MTEKNSYISKQCCDCEDPPDSYLYKPFPRGVTPKSLASEDCTDRSMYNCSKTRVTKLGKGPSQNRDSVMILNDDFGLTKSSNFYEDYVTTDSLVEGNLMTRVATKCGSKKVGCGGTSPAVCASYCDPRLRNAATGDLIKLDRVPYTGHVALENVYNENLRGYGQDYTTYSDIHAWQIQYYMSPDDKEAFQTPVYTLESNTIQSVREDPMGGLIPEYYRDPKTKSILNASRYQHTRDQLRFREDILDGIMYQRNKSDWGLLWEKPISERTPKTYRSYKL